MMLNFRHFEATDKDAERGEKCPLQIAFQYPLCPTEWELAMVPKNPFYVLERPFSP